MFFGWWQRGFTAAGFSLLFPFGVRGFFIRFFDFLGVIFATARRAYLLL